MNMWRNPGEIPGNGVDDDGNTYVDDVHGCNTITMSGDPNDDHSHGTHVAGTVGAVGNNGVGVVGVAWRVQIMACKWITGSGSGTTSDAIEAVDYAIANGAHIINASWRIPAFSQGLLDSIRTAGYHGIILVAAAGNSTLDLDNDANINTFYPAAYDLENIVSVAATTRTDGLASYSNWGRTRVDLGAPGGIGFSSPDAIFSTGNSSDSDYYWNSGTSMAAPHVSGAFALMKAQFPNDSYLQVINRVFSTTDPLTALNGRCQTGGRLNLHRALTSISSRPRNDNFANSYEIVMPSGQTQLTATGNNVDATPETGEPIHGGPNPWRSVWWRWTATSAGTVEIRTQGSTFNTRLAVYTGSSVSSLTLVPGASSVVTDGCSWSQVSFTAASGTTYHIAVDGYYPQFSAEVGSIKLTLRTSGATSQTTLSFDRNTVQRPSGQFTVRVVGPASQTVTLDRFNSTTATWVLNHATFALSALGTHDYTDTQATAPHHIYRCQIGTLKSCNAVGYADISLSASVYKMIANPLNALDNRISALFPNPPNGFVLLKWDEVNDQFLNYTFMQGSGWLPDGNATLAPGEGMLALSGTAFNHSFIGEVRQGYLINPVPSGFSIRSSMRPISGGVASALGTPILEGDIVTRNVNGTDQSFAYRNGFWSNDAGAQVAEPEILVGESFWITKPTDWEQISSVWP